MPVDPTNLPANARSRRLSILLIPVLVLAVSCGRTDQPETLEQDFDGGYGQVEVGGRFAGVEFHHSRPVPSRISFYYPVANSVDLSTDYWERHKSRPVEIVFESDGVADTLGNSAWAYRYTPYGISFVSKKSRYEASVSYGFGLELPIVITTVDVSNTTGDSLLLNVSQRMDLTIRTSHTFAWIRDPVVQIDTTSHTLVAAYRDVGADSASLFAWSQTTSGAVPVLAGPDGNRPQATWSTPLRLAAGETAQLVTIVGMARPDEVDQYVERARREWAEDRTAYEKYAGDYALHNTVFRTSSPAAQEMVGWSKALLAANRHYIDGRFQPMPCPAEYNFFFTHDLLLSSLGAMHFDPDYAAEGFRFLLSLADSTAVLPHAYYWKDGVFRTELADSDSWNHLWFVIALASYLKHTGDVELAQAAYPIAENSIRAMAAHVGDGDLMYAKRPDWWDIGNLYGARTYHTVLMSRALSDFVGLSVALGKRSDSLAKHLDLAGRLKEGLNRRLWDDEAGYLLNGLDQTTTDRHYYSGSLIAGVYGMLGDDRLNVLLDTAADTLLDTALGVRNAMPPDFHELVDVYRFAGQEAGAKWVYFNGAVWPHGNVWYVLGLIRAGRVEEAASALEKYLTLDGIRNSPGGQPAVYEYRRTDPDSPRYGEIDKPSFLWAGGLFLHAVYHLAGYRENVWQIYFDPRVAPEYEETEFDLALNGRISRVTTSGRGPYFFSIEIDGEEWPSAVPVGPATSIELERGIPETPYLAEAECRLEAAEYTPEDRLLRLLCRGLKETNVSFQIVSPWKPVAADLNGQAVEVFSSRADDGIFRISVDATLPEESAELLIRF